MIRRAIAVFLIVVVAGVFMLAFWRHESDTQSANTAKACQVAKDDRRVIRDILALLTKSPPINPASIADPTLRALVGKSQRNGAAFIKGAQDIVAQPVVCP